MSIAEKPILYSYFGSSAGWRVRLILAWKSIEYEYKPIDLYKHEQHSEEYSKINPSKKLPAFITTDGKILTQSMAILEYIEETYPQRPCLPSDPLKRALVREICYEFASDIHPIQNPGLLAEIGGDDMDKRHEWARIHIMHGLEALEHKLFDSKVVRGIPGKYCVGDNVTLADFLLVPQVYNALRYSVELKNCAFIRVANYHLTSLSEFMETMPEKQSDYVPHWLLPYYKHVPRHIDNNSQ